MTATAALGRRTIGISVLGLGAALGAAALLSQSLSLPTRLQDAVTLATGVFLESLAFVFLGILLGAIVQVWVPMSLWHRVLPRRPVLRRAVLSLLGVLMPVCECGNVPLARGLMQRGFTTAESLTFLLAAPVLNPVTIVTTYQAFGWQDGILLARLGGAFVIAQCIGWVVAHVRDERDLLTPSFQAQCEHQPHEAQQSSVARAVGIAVTEARVLLPALVIGSVLAGAIQAGVPRTVLLGIGSHPVLSVVALMLLAFIVSLCSSIDAFFILTFSSTFLPGGIVAFLVFGAMLDLKMLMLLSTTFRPRLLAFMVLTVGLACLSLGWGINSVFA
ncbi:permease [Leucobacter sp. UCMA 4100]|uniref:permease n=1 Tax=Leucobacter sp. UCMA 4100 TaxID=2810534 RepID=UPI0022EAF184|nr:permease [Leucobacter sp. UCMA 4100]MDA3147911.1 permease [Leucobacter sp. UCMA 4100]